MNIHYQTLLKIELHKLLFWYLFEHMFPISECYFHILVKNLHNIICTLNGNFLISCENTLTASLFLFLSHSAITFIFRISCHSFPLWRVLSIIYLRAFNHSSNLLICVAVLKSTMRETGFYSRIMTSLSCVFLSADLNWLIILGTST